MLEPGAKEKEAKSPGNVAREGIAFYAWPDGARPGTVPVYRLSQGGSTTKVIFTTDRAWRDKLVASDVNNANGWKDGGIPFYAFPPTYQAVAANGTPQANPYDCSIKENFVSDRCTAQRNNLANAVASGAIAASNDCPATLEAYIKEPFPSRFPQECQDKWNKELSNCSIKENFVSDRCSDARAALEKAEQDRIAAEKAAVTRATNGVSNNTEASGPGSVANVGNNEPATQCPAGQVFFGGSCRDNQQVETLGLVIECQNKGRSWINGSCAILGGRNWECKMAPGEVYVAILEITKPKEEDRWRTGDYKKNTIYNVKNYNDAYDQCIAMVKFVNAMDKYRDYTVDGVYEIE
jgi:hypothetical protein